MTEFIPFTVSIKQSASDSVSTVLLTSQKEKDIHEILVNITDCLNLLNELRQAHKISDELFSELMQIDLITGEASIKADFLTIYNNSFR